MTHGAQQAASVWCKMKVMRAIGEAQDICHTAIVRAAHLQSNAVVVVKLAGIYEAFHLIGRSSNPDATIPVNECSARIPVEHLHITYEEIIAIKSERIRRATCLIGFIAVEYSIPDGEFTKRSNDTRPKCCRKIDTPRLR